MKILNIALGFIITAFLGYKAYTDKLEIIVVIVAAFFVVFVYLLMFNSIFKYFNKRNKLPQVFKTNSLVFLGFSVLELVFAALILSSFQFNNIYQIFIYPGIFFAYLYIDLIAYKRVTEK